MLFDGELVFFSLGTLQRTDRLDRIITLEPQTESHSRLKQTDKTHVPRRNRSSEIYTYPAVITGLLVRSRSCFAPTMARRMSSFVQVNEGGGVTTVQVGHVKQVLGHGATCL